MGKVIDCLRIEFLLLHRMKWIYAAMMLTLIYVGYSAHLNLKFGSAGEVMNNSGYLVQGGIFLFLFYGIILTRMERDSDAEEVFLTLPGGFLSKVLAKLFHLILLNAILCVSSLGIVFLEYKLDNIPNPFYGQGALYGILYWFLPFSIAGIIGLTIGLLVRTKLAFPIGMVVGILTGPLNTITYISLVKSLPAVLEQIMFMINLGQTDLFRAYHIVYGYPLEDYRWVMKAILLIVSLLLLGLVILFLQKREVKMRLAAGVAFTISACLLVSYGWNLYSPYVDGMTSRKVLKVDHNYYRENVAGGFTRSDPFVIQRYEMEIEVRDVLSNKVKMHLTPKTRTNQLTFTLYHSLKVRDLTVEAQESTFTQEGDYVTVRFAQDLKPGHSYQLSMSYEGDSPKRFFANKHAVMLPGFLAWYPVPSMQPVATFTNSGTHYYSYRPENEVEYVLNYKGPHPVYSNLTESIPGTRTGTSAAGVVLVSGAMEKVDVGDVKVIRPYALYDMSSDLEGELAALQSLSKEISRTLDTDTKPIRQVFFLETRLTNSEIWLEDGYMIMDADLLSNHNQFLRPNEDKVRLLTKASVRTYAWERQDSAMQDLYVDAFSYWFLKSRGQIQKDESAFIRSYPHSLVGSRAQYRETYQQLVRFIDQHVHDESFMKAFYQEWMIELQGEEPVGWAEIRARITKYEKENSYANARN